MRALIPLVEARLDADDALVRGAAIWALRRLAPERAGDLSLAYLARESDSSVASEWTVDICMNAFFFGLGFLIHRGRDSNAANWCHDCSHIGAPFAPPKRPQLLTPGGVDGACLRRHRARRDPGPGPARRPAM